MCVGAFACVCVCVWGGRVSWPYLPSARSPSLHAWEPRDYYHPGFDPELNPNPIELVMLLEEEEEEEDEEEEEVDVEVVVEREGVGEGGGIDIAMGNRRGKSFFQSRCFPRQELGDWAGEGVEGCCCCCCCCCMWAPAYRTGLFIPNKQA